MENDRKWIIVRIDGKIAAISTDYRLLARVSEQIAYGRKSGNDARPASPAYQEVRADTVTSEDVWQLRHSLSWDDLMLFGTDFQKRVWRKLWELTHQEEADNTSAPPENRHKHKLICYSDFAELCQNRAGVRTVAHAVGLNPISVVLPCHLVIPKETIDRIREIQTKAEQTIFKGDDLCLESILTDPAVDFGNYALGRKLKRELIIRELTEKPHSD